MATKVFKTKVDDLTGEEGATTYYFALGAASYEIDLADDGAALRKALEPFIRNGRRARSTSYGRQQAVPERSAYLTKVRQWAQENDIKVSRRGRVAQYVIDAFEADLRATGQPDGQ